MNSVKPDLAPQVDEIFAQVGALTKQVLNHDPKGPVYGVTDNIVIAPDLRTLLARPSTMLSCLLLARKEGVEGEADEWPEDHEEVVGFSMAVPIGEMAPKREAESAETAYVYYVAIDPDHQGLRLVSNLMHDMHEQLRERGFSFFEIDASVKSGYADDIDRAYEGAVVKRSEHEGYPGSGAQCFFRIDLSKVPLPVSTG